MEFINECNCIVDYEILKKSIIEDVYRLIGKYMVGCNLGSEIHVHHIDGNKLNNNVSNLQVIKNELHIKEHHIEQYVSDKHKRNFGNRTKGLISRKD